MTDAEAASPLPVRGLARSLAAAGRHVGLPASEVKAGDRFEAGPGGEAWRDAVAALGLDPEGLDSREAPGVGEGADLAEAFRDPLPPPDPRSRPTPPPVGPAPPAAVREALEGVPDRVLSFPARAGRLAGHLVAWGADEVRAHEPDPRLRRRLEARADGTPSMVPAEAPATELGYHREVEAAVADRPLGATRSPVGLLGRLHHALEDGGRLVLVVPLLDEAEEPSTPRNRWARALRVHVRARGRDLGTRQDLWRLLVETGFQDVRFQPSLGGRYVVRARK